MYHIDHGAERMAMDESGLVSRPAIGMSASGEWRITGAVVYNNFGHIVGRHSLADIKAGRVTWKHANGKHRAHVTDIDHGTARVWMSPDHAIWAA